MRVAELNEMVFLRLYLSLSFYHSIRSNLGASAIQEDTSGGTLSAEDIRDGSTPCAYARLIVLIMDLKMQIMVSGSLNNCCFPRKCLKACLKQF